MHRHVAVVPSIGIGQWTSGAGDGRRRPVNLNHQRLGRFLVPGVVAGEKGQRRDPFRGDRDRGGTPGRQRTAGLSPGQRNADLLHARTACVVRGSEIDRDGAVVPAVGVRGRRQAVSGCGWGDIRRRRAGYVLVVDHQAAWGVHRKTGWQAEDRP